MRAFVDYLYAEIRSTSVANVVDNLFYAARLIASERDWQWLASIKARLFARARPEDRFGADRYSVVFPSKCSCLPLWWRGLPRRNEAIRGGCWEAGAKAVPGVSP